jgi:hypothetical protein
LHQGVSPGEKKELIEQLREKFTSVAGAKIEVKDFEQVRRSKHRLLSGFRETI